MPTFTDIPCNRSLKLVTTSIIKTTGHVEYAGKWKRLKDALSVSLPPIVGLSIKNKTGRNIRRYADQPLMFHTPQFPVERPAIGTFGIDIVRIEL